MGYLKYVRQAWKQPKKNLKALWKERLILWRKDNVTTRIEHPTRIDRARSLGYKAKEGYVIVRQRIKRGGKRRPDIKGGRRTAHSSQKLDLRINYQRVAEDRAVSKYPNCEVLNSYWVAKDGVSYWYEIILVDRSHPSILSDQRISWIANEHGRVKRGLTSSGKKSRGFLRKGKGAEKIRPSRRANLRRH
ncbi:MAG: 50S ribosomal protein L15e [Nanoarchaeota archaeon]